MIEADHLIFNRSSRDPEIWVSRKGDSVLGEMIFHPPAALVPTEVLKSANSAKCAIGVFEACPQDSNRPANRLWLAGKFSGICNEILDAGGKTIGGWQGEWLRMFNHPAGRMISRDSFRWDWINPAGFALASWELVATDEWRIDFHGLKPNQAFCRMLALLKAGEVTTESNLGLK